MALKIMLKQLGLHSNIAKTIGKKRTTVSNALRLLNLPPEVRKSIRIGEITAGHGRAILQKKTISAMKILWKKIINESLSVRSAEALVKSKVKNTKLKKIINESLSVRSAEALVKPKVKNTKLKKIIVPKGPVRALENQLIEIFIIQHII